jgi:hypothetical protein
LPKALPGDSHDRRTAPFDIVEKPWLGPPQAD